MDRELVSVLMVNYNRGTTIGESIKSVLAQTYTDLELIIVDDGSTDDSCSVQFHPIFEDLFHAFDTRPPVRKEVE